MTSCTYVNVEVVQLEDLGGWLLVSNEPEDLKIATVPFDCPHLPVEIDKLGISINMVTMVRTKITITMSVIIIPVMPPYQLVPYPRSS